MSNTLQNFSIKCTSEGHKMEHCSFIARWEDAKLGRRYHVWYYGGSASLGLEPTLHSNPLVDKDRSRRGDHRELDLNAKTWSRERAELVRLVTPEALVAAREARIAELAEQERQALVAEAQRYRDAFDHECGRLVLEGKGQLAHEIRITVQMLNDEDMRRLGRLIRSA